MNSYVKPGQGVDLKDLTHEVKFYTIINLGSEQNKISS